MPDIGIEMTVPNWAPEKENAAKDARSLGGAHRPQNDVAAG